MPPSGQRGFGKQENAFKRLCQIKAEGLCLKDDKKLFKVLPVNAEMTFFFLAAKVNVISETDTTSEFLDYTFKFESNTCFKMTFMLLLN